MHQLKYIVAAKIAKVICLCGLGALNLDREDAMSSSEGQEMRSDIGHQWIMASHTSLA